MFTHVGKKITAVKKEIKVVVRCSLKIFIFIFMRKDVLKTIECVVSFEFWKPWAAVFDSKTQK